MLSGIPAVALITDEYVGQSSTPFIQQVTSSQLASQVSVAFDLPIGSVALAG
jgi:hypothetical protein